MSVSWTMRSGRSSLTSPMDTLVPLDSFPPLNPPPLPPLFLLLLPPSPPPPDGPCVTRAPLLGLVRHLHLNQPDLRLTPHSTRSISRYTLSEIARLVLVSWWYSWLVAFLFGFWALLWMQQSKNSVSQTLAGASGDSSIVDRCMWQDLSLIVKLWKLISNQLPSLCQWQLTFSSETLNRYVKECIEFVSREWIIYRAPVVDWVVFSIVKQIAAFQCCQCSCSLERNIGYYNALTLWCPL